MYLFKDLFNLAITSFQSCYRCKLNMKEGDPAVYAERAGYDKLWHPACFVCCTCSELLVDMIYFWKNGNLYCGRHYCDSEKPRCAGCDEVGNILVLCFSTQVCSPEKWIWFLVKYFSAGRWCAFTSFSWLWLQETETNMDTSHSGRSIACFGFSGALGQSTGT